MQALLWGVVEWIFRGVLIKFVILTAIISVVALLVPVAVGYMASFIGVDSLTNAFTALPSGVWWFMDFFRLDFGLPLIISAFVSRFLIRRLPVIG